MTRRRYIAPNEWVSEIGKWPEGPFVLNVPGYAGKTAKFVQRVEAALAAGDETARQLALRAGIDPSSLSRLRAGHVVPDLGTIDSLETTLNVSLWCADCHAHERAPEGPEG